MKKKLRAMSALLKSRAYLDSQEAAALKHTPRDESHHEYERGQNEPFQPVISEDQNNARVALSGLMAAPQFANLLRSRG